MGSVTTTLTIAGDMERIKAAQKALELVGTMADGSAATRLQVVTGEVSARLDAIAGLNRAGNTVEAQKQLTALAGQTAKTIENLRAERVIGAGELVETQADLLAYFQARAEDLGAIISGGEGQQPSAALTSGLFGPAGQIRANQLTHQGRYSVTSGIRHLPGQQASLDDTLNAALGNLQGVHPSNLVIGLSTELEVVMTGLGYSRGDYLAVQARSDYIRAHADGSIILEDTIAFLDSGGSANLALAVLRPSAEMDTRRLSIAAHVLTAQNAIFFQAPLRQLTTPMVDAAREMKAKELARLGPADGLVAPEVETIFMGQGLTPRAADIFFHEATHLADSRFLSDWIAANQRLMRAGQEPDKLFRALVYQDSSGLLLVDNIFYDFLTESRAYQVSHYVEQTLRRSDGEVHPESNYRELTLLNVMNKYGARGAKFVRDNGLTPDNVWERANANYDYMRATIQRAR